MQVSIQSGQFPLDGAEELSRTPRAVVHGAEMPDLIDDTGE